jgi:hypothetical protein
VKVWEKSVSRRGNRDIKALVWQRRKQVWLRCSDDVESNGQTIARAVGRDKLYRT